MGCSFSLVSPAGLQAGALAFAQPPFVVFLLQLGAVEEDELRQVAGGVGGEDLAAKAIGMQHWQPPAMVEVGVGEEGSVHVARGEGELFVARFQRPPALEHAAIHQKGARARLQQETGAGHLAGRADRRDFHAANLRGVESATSVA